MSKHFLTNNAREVLVNSAGQYLYEQVTLPAEYQEVQYIGTSGTQYIDTGYILTSNNFRVELQTEFTGSNTSSFASYVGFMKTSSSVTPRFGIHNYTAGKYIYGADSTISTDFPTTRDEVLLIFNGTGKSQSLTVNGATSSSSTSYNMSTNALSMYLGARNVANARNNALSAKFYRFKLIVNDIPVRDLIPCYRKSDNVIGMYDIINNNFYTNAGTGSFTKGSNLYD